VSLHVVHDMGYAVAVESSAFEHVAETRCGLG
jgi:hypothetical protein